MEVTRPTNDVLVRADVNPIGRLSLLLMYRVPATYFSPAGYVATPVDHIRGWCCAALAEYAGHTGCVAPVFASRFIVRFGLNRSKRRVDASLDQVLFSRTYGANDDGDC